MVRHLLFWHSLNTDNKHPHRCWYQSGQPPDFLPIDFLIIGGSICGLSSAIALRRAGHNVTVFDLCSPLEPVRGRYRCS